MYKHTVATIGYNSSTVQFSTAGVSWFLLRLSAKLTHTYHVCPTPNFDTRFTKHRHLKESRIDVFDRNKEYRHIVINSSVRMIIQSEPSPSRAVDVAGRNTPGTCSLSSDLRMLVTKLTDRLRDLRDPNSAASWAGSARKNTAAHHITRTLRLFDGRVLTWRASVQITRSLHDHLANGTRTPTQ